MSNAQSVEEEKKLPMVEPCSFIVNAAQTFDGIQKIAQLMAKMGTLPKHLQGNEADCFRVVVQAAKWRMDPFAVAECTSVIHGHLCHEGKLVAAALYSMGALKGRLKYKITGTGQNASIVVTGTPRGGEEVSMSGTVKEWRTNGEGSPWDKQPEMQLIYRGTRQWARAYAPEAMLGIYTPEEMEEVQYEEVKKLPAILQPQEKSTAPAPDADPAGADPVPGSNILTIPAALVTADKSIIDVQGYVVDVKHYAKSDKGPEKTYYTIADNDGKKMTVSAYGSPFEKAVVDGECRILFTGVAVADSAGKRYFNGDKKRMQVVNA